MSNDSFDDDQEIKREIRRLDGVLPEEIDRRSFFKQAIAGVAGASLLAGCSGDEADAAGNGNGGDNGNGNSTDTGGDETEYIDPGQVRFRNFWKPKPGYAFEYMTAVGAMSDYNKPAFLEEEMKIKPPEMEAGANDATKYTGTGKAELGLGGWSVIVNGLTNEYNSSAFGMSNPKAFVGLIYNKDKIQDIPGDLEGKKIAQTGHLMEITWPLYENSFDNLEIGGLEFVEENIVGSFLKQGKYDAVWTTINDVPVFEDVAGEEGKSIGVDPLYNHNPVYGLPLVANNDFKDNNPEYMKKYLTGYSMAGKWSLLNPEKVINIFREEIRPELKTVNFESQKKQMKISVFWTNLTDKIKNNGVGYINKDVAENSTQAFLKSFDMDTSKYSTDDIVDYSIQEEAELDSFSSDEWSQVQEFAKPYSNLFG